MNAPENTSLGQWNRWRIVGWTIGALILLVPLIAMQFTDEVAWTLSDFVFAAVMVGGVGLLYETAVRKSGDGAYRAGTGVALAAAFFLIWVNGAVGIIGSESNPANLMYYGLFIVGLVGAFVARFRAAGLARTMLAVAGAQVVIVAIVLIYGLGGAASGPVEVIGVNLFFMMFFLGAARLYQVAAQGTAPATDASR